MKDTYTKALLDLFSQDDIDSKAVLRGFQATLEKRGHSSLYAPVLQAVLRILSAERPATVVTVARTKDSTRQAAAIAEALSELGATSSTEAVVDETLIGGYVVEHGHRRIDNSYKTKLVRLYQSLTK